MTIHFAHALGGSAIRIVDERFNKTGILTGLTGRFIGKTTQAVTTLTEFWGPAEGWVVMGMQREVAEHLIELTYDEGDYGSQDSIIAEFSEECVARALAAIHPGLSCSPARIIKGVGMRFRENKEFAVAFNIGLEAIGKIEVAVVLRVSRNAVA